MLMLSRPPIKFGEEQIFNFKTDSERERPVCYPLVPVVNKSDYNMVCSPSWSLFITNQVNESINKAILCMIFLRCQRTPRTLLLLNYRQHPFPKGLARKGNSTERDQRHPLSLFTAADGKQSYDIYTYVLFERPKRSPPHTATLLGGVERFALQAWLFDLNTHYHLQSLPKNKA